jgi:hypothetical protein
MQVGTYIGERLLYAPSIGYCILLADLVAWLAGDALPGILQLWRESPGANEPRSLISPHSHNDACAPANLTRAAAALLLRGQQVADTSGLSAEHGEECFVAIAGHLKDEGLKSERRKMGMRGRVAAVLLVVMLTGYTWRTFDRNWDWEDEERLFRSALKVRQFPPSSPLFLPCLM